MILSAFAIVIWLIIDYIQKIRLKFLKNHVVICGLGYLGREIALHYSKTTPVIVIERNQDNDDLLLCRSYGISVIVGDATKREVLESARVNRAKQVYLVTGRDDLNTEIAVKCEEILRKSSHAPVCGHVHLENRDLWQAFQVCNKESSKSPGAGNPKQFHMDFFNLYQIAGFCVLREHPPFTDTERAEGSTPCPGARDRKNGRDAIISQDDPEVGARGRSENKNQDNGHRSARYRRSMNS